MKKIISISLLLILLASCKSTYFYPTLNNVDGKNVKQLSDGKFLIEDDLVDLTYSFNGKDAPVQVSIYNKSDKPLYIDWSRSALIINEETFYFTPMKSTKSKEPQSKGLYSAAPEMEQTNAVSFLLPQARITHSVGWLKNFSVGDLSNASYATGTIPDKDGIPQHVDIAQFGDSTTPYKFRTSLTVYFSSKEDVSIVNQDFYISKILKSGDLKPWTMPNDLASRGDIFYTK